MAQPELPNSSCRLDILPILDEMAEGTISGAKVKEFAQKKKEKETSKR